MNKTTIVVFLLLASTIAFANNSKTEIQQIESQWAELYYTKSSIEQENGYPTLLTKTRTLLKDSPDNAELMIWDAIITSTNAAYQNPFSALNAISDAKKQLERAIQINPSALEGAAYVALGSLYHMTPGWPISFGDELKAKKMLQQALNISPQSIDSNYFYAEYLLTQENIEEAHLYLQRALLAPIRPNQIFADQQLKKEVLNTLYQTQQRKLKSGKNKFFSIFTSANAE